MFPLLKRERAVRVGVGVSFNPQGFSYAVIRGEREGRQLFTQGVVDCGPADLGPALAQLVRQQRLKGVPAVVALEPDDYSLFQIEAPEAPPEEMPLAIRWRVKDMLDYHVDDARLDFFMLPQGRRPGMPRLMYVVAARAAGLKPLADRVIDSGLDLQALDICELALRNLFVTADREPPPQVLLFLGPRFSLIEIFRGGVLYLSRRIKLLSVDLTPNQGELPTDPMEAIVLEIQRSMDYCENQFSIPPMERINLVCPDAIRGGIVDYCTENLSVTVGALATKQPEGVEALSGDRMIRLLPAIGAARGAL
ncbi:MAG: hypothetical protein KJ558_11640 [Gammaproteobacteria bacterium]|nr:hypothetical protein [Gammaproteobacteria bacterium]MBU1962424.1 hypothetical protein [Gammaproteobacteria bacterium]